MNFRMISPSSVGQVNVNGRNYTQAAGKIIDVIDADGAMLAANGWGKVALSGPTSGRPPFNGLGIYSGLTIGLKYWDTTIGQLVVSDGVTWRDPATGNAV